MSVNTPRPPKKPPVVIAEATIASFAAQVAAYRLNPGRVEGQLADIQLRVRQVASRHRQSFSMVWGDIHKSAYEIVDAAS